MAAWTVEKMVGRMVASMEYLLVVSMAAWMVDLMAALSEP